MFFEELRAERVMKLPVSGLPSTLRDLNWRTKCRKLWGKSKEDG